MLKTTTLLVIHTPGRSRPDEVVESGALKTDNPL